MPPPLMSRIGAFVLALCLSALPMCPATRAAVAPEVVRISTLPGLRYDTSAFSVRPGADVELVFSNYDEMVHNLVITRPGARERVVQAALALGAGAADRNFVPPSPDVLWATKVVPTDQAVTLRFTAPTIAGDYPYVCTLPGHGLVMFGTMRVTNTPGPPVMTPIEPAERAGAGDGGVAISRATVVRTFMPDAGPASIAVQLPGGASYVFDAGAGRFRYAWTGGGVIVPSSPERGLARITGQVFYREPAFPLRLGASQATPPKLVEFKGYSRDAAGIPEFEVVVDGVTIRERVEVRAGRLARRFRIAHATTVWFAIPEGVAGLDVPLGRREGGFFRLTGGAAQEFVVTYALPTTAPSLR
jgi:azurin